MPTTDELALKYREILIQREETARRAILRNYRGAWRGLEEKIDATMQSLQGREDFNEELGKQIAIDSAGLADGQQIEYSEEKIGKVAKALLGQKKEWRELENSIDLDFEGVADGAAELTRTHGAELGGTAVDHAVRMMTAELKDYEDQEKAKDKDYKLPAEVSDDLNKRVREAMERSWATKKYALEQAFRVKAAQAAKEAREALRREVMLGVLTGAGAGQILDRVKTAIEKREGDPEKDPALVRGLRSEYRLAIQENSRETLRLTYQLSGAVKQWRWTSALTARTCAVCWANDGKIYSVGQTLRSHPHCRCVLTPIVEPEKSTAARPTGQQKFARLSLEAQKAVLGTKAFAAYQKGEFELADLVGIQYNERFGVTLYRKSIDDAKADAYRGNAAAAPQVTRVSNKTALREATQDQQALTRQRKQRQIMIDSIPVVDTGQSKIETREMSVEDFWEIKKGFRSGDIVVPVSSVFLLRMYPGEVLTPEILLHHALKNLQAEYFFSDAAIERYYRESTGLTYSASGKPVTQKSLAEDVRTSVAAPGKDDDDIKFQRVRFSTAILQKLYKYDREEVGDTDALRRLDYEIERRAKEAEFEKRRPKNNIIAEAFWSMERTNALKDFERDFWSRQGDLRDKNRADANELADSIADFFRSAIEYHPLYRLLPEEVKKKLVEAGVGGVNGAISLGNSVLGVRDFLNDATFDLFVTGMQKLGLDKSIPGFETVIAENYRMREERKAFVEKYSNLKTADMEGQEIAYQQMIANGLPVTLYDMTNNAANVGNFAVQALPFIALALASGGSGTLVLAGVGGALATGGTYRATNNYTQALWSGALATAQGAAGGLTNKLPFLGNLAADALTTYTFGKLTGQTDEEIFRQLAMQTGFAAGLKTKELAGSRFSERSFAPGGAMHAEILKARYPDMPVTQRLNMKMTAAEAKEYFFRMMGEETGASSRQILDGMRRDIQLEQVRQRMAEENRAASQTANPNRAQTTGGRQTTPITTRTNRAGRVVRAKEALEKLRSEYGKDNKLVTMEQEAAARREIRLWASRSSRFLNVYAADPTIIKKWGEVALAHVEAGARSFRQFLKIMEPVVLGKKASTADYEALYRAAFEEYIAKKQTDGATKQELEQLKIDEDGITAVKKEEADAQVKKENAAKENTAKKNQASNTGKVNQNARTKKGTVTSAKKIETSEATPAKPNEAEPQKTENKNSKKKEEKKELSEKEQADLDRKTYANYGMIEKLLNQKPTDIDFEFLRKEGYVITAKDGELTVTISRPKNTANQAEGANWAKLVQDGEGNLVIDRDPTGHRLSKPTEMKNNFKDKLTELYKNKFTKLSAEQLKTMVKDIIENFAHHHIISDNIVRKTKLGILAQRAGYNLDRSDNLIGMVKEPRLIGDSETTGKFENDYLEYKTGHWDYHPQYDADVRSRVNSGFEALRKKYLGRKKDPLDLEDFLENPELKLPKDVQDDINNEMKIIENMFRRKIKKGQVPKRPDQSIGELYIGVEYDDHNA